MATTDLSPVSLLEISPLGVYLRFLKEGKLAYQRDLQTGQAVFFPRHVAPGSGLRSLEWQISEGWGRVYATTVVYRKNEEPYNVALIRMEEGFQLMSRVEGCLPTDVRIGQRVTVQIHAPESDAPYPVFRLSTGELP